MQAGKVDRLISLCSPVGREHVHAIAAWARVGRGDIRSCERGDWRKGGINRSKDIDQRRIERVVESYRHAIVLRQVEISRPDSCVWKSHAEEAGIGLEGDSTDYYASQSKYAGIRKCINDRSCKRVWLGKTCSAK